MFSYIDDLTCLFDKMYDFINEATDIFSFDVKINKEYTSYSFYNELNFFNFTRKKSETSTKEVY